MERLRRFRFLIILCSLSIFVGVWKANKRDDPPGTEFPPDRKVFIERFPDRVESEYDLGLEHFLKREYPQALVHFRNAVATGVKTNEDLLWYYALTLMHEKQEEAEIDAAVNSWRRNFPHSDTYYDPYWFYALSLRLENAGRKEIETAIARWEAKKLPDSKLENPRTISTQPPATDRKTRPYPR